MAKNLLIELVIEEIFGTFNSTLYNLLICAREVRPIPGGRFTQINSKATKVHAVNRWTLSVGVVTREL